MIGSTISDDQARQVIALIEDGGFVGASCEAVGVHRVTFWRLLRSRPDLKQLKKDADEISLEIRRDEADKIKWTAYQQLLSEPKYSTIAIWYDKTSLGLRETQQVEVINREPLKLFDITPEQIAEVRKQDG